MLTLNQVKLLVKLLLFCALLGGSNYATWWIVTDHAQKVAVEAELRQNEAVTVAAQAQLDEVSKNDKLTHNGVYQHAKDTLFTNDLFDALVRVRVQTTICSSSPAEAAGANPPELPSSGVASTTDVDTVAEFKREIDKIGLECASLNNEVRQRNIEEGLIP